MRVLFNCTTNVVGGGVQNAANFILSTFEDPQGIDWYYAVSPQVYGNIRGNINPNCSKIVVFDASPTRSKRSRKTLLGLSRTHGVDLVYTMAGPAYVSFDCLHVCGLSNPYTVGTSLRVFFRNRSWHEGLRLFWVSLYQRWALRSVDHLIFQTDLSRKRYSLSLFSKPTNWSIVGNSLASAVVESNLKRSHNKGLVMHPSKRTLDVLIPSAYYAHKDIELVFSVAASLGEEYCFLFTLPDETFSKLSSYYSSANNIQNLGQFDIADVADVYSKCDIVLMPSVLEVFSTSYLEALYFEKPLVVADLDFAIDVCGEYAIYFKAFSSESLMDALGEAARQVQHDDFRSGREYVLRKYGVYSDRYQSLVDILKSALPE